MVLSANTYYQGDSAITAIYQGDVKVWPPVQQGVLIYASTDNNVITPNVNTGFGANILSNTYSGGQGTILFDGPVTTIPSGAFTGKTTLREIVFADTITTIDANSFSGCTSLGSVNISSGITSVGNFAFRNCTAVSSITLSEGLQTLGAASFFGCSSISAVTIPSTVTSFGQSAFQNCSALSSVTISSGVTNVGHSAFYNCTAISSVTLPNSVTSISDRAFYGCTALSSITFSSGVTSIGINCFNKSLYLNVYYGGLYSQWQNITFGSVPFADSATIHYRYNSKTSATCLGSTGFTNSSNQHFYLGISLSLDTEITIGYRGAGITGGTTAPAGAWIGCASATTTSTRFYFYINSNTGSTLYWGSNSIGGNIGLKPTSGNNYNLEIKNYSLTNLDNSQYKSGSKITTLPTENRSIEVNMKRWWIRSIVIKKGGTTVLNVTPCTCDNVAGFYDSITDTFMTIPNLRTS